MRFRFKRFRLRSRRWWWRLEKRYRDHPRLFPMVACAAIVFLTAVLVFTLRDSAITVQKLEANIVILHADNETKMLPTREATVGDFLNKAGIMLHEGDVVEPSLDTPIEEDDFRVNVYRAAPVTIVDGERRILAYSAAQTSRSIADQAGIKLYPEDVVSTERSMDFLRDGISQRVVVKRSLPINLNLYGSPLPLRTQAVTVGDLLKEKKVQLAEGDSVQPSPETELYDQIQIFVTRFGTEVVTTEETISAPTETVNDTTLSFGTTVVRQAGAAGKKSVTYQVELTNGRESRRTLIQEVIIQEPVPRVIARGRAVSIPSDKTAAMSAAGIKSGDHAFVNYIISRESRWNVVATNASTGAYGLCQALPGSKMASAGSDWQSNAVTQLKWCNGYAVGRYGSWSAAYDFWVEHHWW